MASFQDPLRIPNVPLTDEATDEIPLNDETNAPVTTGERSVGQPYPASGPLLAPATSNDPLDAGDPSRQPSSSASPKPAAGKGLVWSQSSEISRLEETDRAGNNSSALDNIDLGRSTDDAGHAMAAAASAAGPSNRPVASVFITVTDPVKRVSDHAFIPGLTSSHYEYLVSSSPASDADDAEWQRREVRRRFNDFVALADLLLERQRGYFIFPRPDKGALEGAAVGRSEAEFVEVRRGDLERYLRRLAAHPVVGRSEELRVFLTAEGSLASSFQWQQLQPLRGSFLEGMARLPRQLLGADPSVPSTADAAKNPKHSNDLLRRLRELGERMRQEYHPPESLSEDEVSLRQTKAAVELYTEAVANASRRAEKLLREFETLGMVVGDLGLSMIRLGKYEDEEGSRCGAYTSIGSSARTIATDARRLGMAAVRVSRLARSATGESVSALETLHTELALAPAVIEALQEREAALLTLQSIKEDMSRKQAAVEALEIAVEIPDGDSQKLTRAQHLKNELAALEAAAEVAQIEYDRVKSRNLEELKRYNGERAGEFRRMATAYSRVATIFESRASEVWQGAAEDLGISQPGV